jgi:hypothetical protein
MTTLSLVSESFEMANKANTYWRYTVEDVWANRYITSLPEGSVSAEFLAETLKAFEIGVFRRVHRVLMAKSVELDAPIESALKTMAAIMFRQYCQIIAQLIPISRDLTVDVMLTCYQTDDFFEASLLNIDRKLYGKFASGSMAKHFLEAERKIVNRMPQVISN